MSPQKNPTQSAKDGGLQAVPSAFCLSKVLHLKQQQNKEAEQTKPQNSNKQIHKTPNKKNTVCSHEGTNIGTS